jgi:hypothetical protein
MPGRPLRVARHAPFTSFQQKGPARWSGQSALEVGSQTRSACLTCRAMLGSGVRTGILRPVTVSPRQLTLRVRLTVKNVCNAADRGWGVAGAYDARCALVVNRARATEPMDSASRGIRDTFVSKISEKPKRRKANETAPHSDAYTQLNGGEKRAQLPARLSEPRGPGVYGNTNARSVRGSSTSGRADHRPRG